MKANLSLGRVFGVKIKVHWTFFIMVIWLVFEELQRGGNAESIGYYMALMLSIFISIVLHELGHAFMARRFNINTKDITLWPMGGVASLEKIPASPKQELLIAIAGPLVNVLIAIVLYFTIPVADILNENTKDWVLLLNPRHVENFVFCVFLANITLALFNGIPAFPMDGGRVLRSLLALKITRLKATQIATIIGQIFAAVFFLLGLLFTPILLFIALFIFLGAYTENIFVRHLAILKGRKVQDAMITNTTTFSPNDSIGSVLKTIISSTESNFVVIQGGVIIGILYHKDIIACANQENVLVKDILTSKFKLLQQKDSLSKVYEIIYSTSNSFFPVVNKGQFVGVLDAVNLNEYLLIQTRLQQK